MRKRSGKPLPKKGAAVGSIKRFLSAEPEDPEDMDGLGRSPGGVGSGAGSAPRRRPEHRRRSPVSSAGSDGEEDSPRRSGVEALVSDLPTKAELASMLSGLERAIKKEIYNVFPKVVGKIPGPHQKLFKAVHDMHKFIEERVKMHKETLDPGSPRDFIDCFLLKMEQVIKFSDNKLYWRKFRACVHKSDAQKSMHARNQAEGAALAIELPFSRLVVHLVLHRVLDVRNFRQRLCDHVYARQVQANILRKKIHGFVIGKSDREKDVLQTEFHMEGIVHTTFDLFSAGTESVSTTLRYGLLILLKHADVEERIHKEIDHVIGRNRAPCIEDRSRMPYMDAVIHEIQRFLDLSPMGVPHKVTCDVHFRDFIIPKDTTVYTVLGSVLRDPKQFKYPNEFNPGHFLDENGKFRRNDGFMPFSSGKRICLGEGLAKMELFLFFTTILQNFTLKSPVDPQDLDLTPQMSGFGNVPPPYELCFLPR
ncbi:hypothetical protein AB205_0154610 [Aquarana catesbeiana]|uniref:unspecific monooxygenase n=1 Tax=Aquarana catesbeiana TaxID=8400 RepID=A0A2G9SDS2_AQUCT|nr:hypothetical protein AB205_0154610 [Aquarana catesbeiana]